MLSAISVQWQMGHDAKCAFVQRIPIFRSTLFVQGLPRHIIVAMCFNDDDNNNASIGSTAMQFNLFRRWEGKKRKYDWMCACVCAPIHDVDVHYATHFISVDKNMQCVWATTCCMEMKVLLFLFHLAESISTFFSTCCLCSCGNVKF